MCGIIGYVGGRKAVDVLTKGLAKLEYRGYDSAGLALCSKKGDIQIFKAEGKLDNLQSVLQGESLDQCLGIGHTRWATHGEANETNAHPHVSDAGNKVVLVHNGIIENYKQLKSQLADLGYEFYSDTDTEVAAKLIFQLYSDLKEPVPALVKFMEAVTGSYALAIIFKDNPDKIYAIKKDSPLVVGVAEGESFLASDPSALSEAESVCFLDNYEICELDKGSFKVFDRGGAPIDKALEKNACCGDPLNKAGFPHFMLKEIFEQPSAIDSTICSVCGGSDIDLSAIGLSDETLKAYDNLLIVGCGSSYHVAMALKLVFESLVKIPVRVEYASEFRYCSKVLFGKTLAIFISQSGETADTLAALNCANDMSIDTLSIVNVKNSSIARSSRFVLHTMAGVEVAVATTKAFSTQLVAGYLLAVKMAYIKGQIENNEYIRLIEQIRTISFKVKNILNDTAPYKSLAEKLAVSKDIFVIGRGLDYAVSLEGGLKLKEVSYVHTDAVPAGELKHGTISLIEKGTPVIAVMTQSGLLEKTQSNLEETRSRGALTIALVTDSLHDRANADVVISIGDCEELFSASLAVVPLQLTAYYLSDLLGNDIDKPKNLAKSVTVE